MGEQTEIQVLRGNLSQVLAHQAKDGKPAFTADTQELYVGHDSYWYLVGRANFGTLENRPSANVPGRIYYATDTKNTYISNGANWNRIRDENSVEWDLYTTNQTAVKGKGYACNTTSGAITITLPETPSVGDLVGVKDAYKTSETNNITIARNGENIDGIAENIIIDVNGITAVFCYIDESRGWILVNY